MYRLCTLSRLILFFLLFGLIGPSEGLGQLAAGDPSRGIPLTILTQLPNRLGASPSDDSFFTPGVLVGKSVADDFVVDTVSGLFTIDRLEFWGIYFYSDTPQATDLFSFRILSDDGGLPSSTVLAQGSGAPASRFAEGGTTNTSQGPMTTYHYIFPLAAPVTLANGIYWLELYNDTTVDADDDWGWVQAEVDPEAGRPGAAGRFLASTAPWGFGADVDLSLVIRGAELPMVYHEEFTGGLNSMTGSEVCRGPFNGNGGSWYPAGHCPDSDQAPTPSDTAGWLSLPAECSPSLGNHRSQLESPPISLATCERAALDFHYLIALPGFVQARLMVEVVVDGMRTIVASTPGPAPGLTPSPVCGEEISSVPAPVGGLVNDGNWRAASILLPPGDEVVVRFVGEFSTNSSASHKVFVDDVRVRCSSGIFTDGFESGDMSRWN